MQDTSFWEPRSSRSHDYKDDRVLLLPAIRFVFDKLADHAIAALHTVLLDSDGFRKGLVREPGAPDALQGWTARRSDLLQLCWAITRIPEFYEVLLSPERTRRDAVSRFYSKYGGDPLWVMVLEEWTFPDVPHVTPALLGLIELYEDSSLCEFKIADSIDGGAFYVSRQEADGVLEGAIEKIEYCPREVLSAISHQNIGPLSRKEAWQLARTMGLDREAKRKLAEALQS